MEETAKSLQSGRAERRQVFRYRVDERAHVFLVDVRSRLPGRVLDISMAGCRIRAPERFPVGIFRRVEVEFVLDGLPFRLPGVIQAVHDRFTIGIRFLDVSERKRDQLAVAITELSDKAQDAGERPAASGA